MLTLERREYVSRDVIIEELKTALPSAGHIDHITLSATGEPTLHSRLGEIIRRIKRITSLPVAVLTNGTLLTEKDVREDLLDADVVLPSLDAASPETFRRLNRPHGRIDLMSVIGGLAQFRREYKGPIWLEVLFVKGINDSGLDVRRTREAIERIRPDKVHLNTVVRPPSELCAHPLSRTELEEIARVLDMNCEVIC
jgi:wyosine [tRNA(Phe)-imidazoG37] synthetase (radical SAM superfamily)